MYRYDKDGICKNAKSICQIMFASGYRAVMKPFYCHFDDEKDDNKTITTCDVNFINTNGKKNNMYGINIFASNTESIKLLCENVLIDAINYQKTVKQLESKNNNYAKALSGMQESLITNKESLNIDNFVYFTKIVLEDFVKENKGVKQELQTNLMEGIESLEGITKNNIGLLTTFKNNEMSKIDEQFEKDLLEVNYASIESIDLIEELKTDKSLKGYNPIAISEQQENTTTVMEVLKQRNK